MGVESHLGIISRKRRRLHICITFACVNTSVEAHTLSSYPIYLGENAPPQCASRAPSLQPYHLVIAQVLVTNSNDLFHRAFLYIEAIDRYPLELCRWTQEKQITLRNTAG